MSRRLLVGISAFWLGLSVLGDPVSSLLLPLRLEALAPRDVVATQLGLVTFVGLFAAMLVQPPAAQLSDGLRSRMGRRPLVVAGATIALVGIALVGVSNSVTLVIGGYIVTQVAVSVAQAAQQGFIPDVVPPESRSWAAALKSFLDLGGLVVGSVLVGTLVGGGTALVVAALGAVVLGTLASTVLLARERTDPRAPVSQVRFFRSLWLDMGRHATFVRVVAARFAFLLGTFAVGRFLFLYVGDRLSLESEAAARQTAGLLILLGIVAALAALPAAPLARRVGRAPVMVAAALASGIGTLLFIVATSTVSVLGAGLFLSVGSGAFATANWARTADLVPPGEGARFFAIANYGTVGAMAVAGLAGPLVDAGNRAAQGAGYTMLFVASAICFGVGGTLAATTDRTRQPAPDARR